MRSLMKLEFLKNKSLTSEAVLVISLLLTISPNLVFGIQSAETDGSCVRGGLRPFDLPLLPLAIICPQ